MLSRELVNREELFLCSVVKHQHVERLSMETLKTVNVVPVIRNEKSNA